MEVPTICKAYLSGLCKGISLQKMALYGTVPPFQDPEIPNVLWEIPISIGNKKSVQSVVLQPAEFASNTFNESHVGRHMFANLQIKQQSWCLQHDSKHMALGQNPVALLFTSK